jgi:hypothetical protein
MNRDSAEAVLLFQGSIESQIENLVVIEEPRQAGHVYRPNLQLEFMGRVCEPEAGGRIAVIKEAC